MSEREGAVFSAEIQGFKKVSDDECQELGGELYLPMPLSELDERLNAYGASMSFESYVWLGPYDRDVSSKAKDVLQGSLPLYGDIYGLNRVAQWLLDLGPTGRKALGQLIVIEGNSKQALGRTVKEIFDEGKRK